MAQSWVVSLLETSRGPRYTIGKAPLLNPVQERAKSRTSIDTLPKKHNDLLGLGLRPEIKLNFVTPSNSVRIESTSKTHH